MYNNEINISNVFDVTFGKLGVYGKYRYHTQYPSLNTKPTINIVIEDRNSNPDERKSMLVELNMEQLDALIAFCRYLEETLTSAVNEEDLYNG